MSVEADFALAVKATVEAVAGWTLRDTPEAVDRCEDKTAILLAVDLEHDESANETRKWTLTTLLVLVLRLGPSGAGTMALAPLLDGTRTMLAAIDAAIRSGLLRASVNSWKGVVTRGRVSYAVAKQQPGRVAASVMTLRVHWRE